MSAREISKRARSEDEDCINKELKDVIDLEKDYADNGNSDEHAKNVFDELLNKEKSTDLLNIQDKNKGSKVRSWIYLWGNRINHPTDPKRYIYVCDQVLDNGKNCTTRIETSGSTGNIISHLNRKHKIFEHSKPSTTTPSLKQVKISNYTISSTSSQISEMTQERQKHLETLLFEWLILDFQPLYLLKSPSFRRFINALNENFELPTDKKFRKRILEAYEFSQKQLKQYIQKNAISVSLTCDL